MNDLRPYLAAAAGIFRRDLTVYVTYRWRLGTQYVGVLFSLAVFYYISRLVQFGQFSSPDSYFSYAAVGVIILQVLQSTLDIPGTVRQELVAGTFERMAVSPFGPVAAILSLFLFPLTAAVISMLVTLGLAALIFGIDASWSTVPLAIPIAVIGAAALGAIALLFAAMVVRFKQAPGTAYVLAAISLVAGFYFPPSLLPWWLEWASNVQPFTPAVDLLRHLLVGQPLSGSAWVDVGKLVGFTVVLVPIGLAGLSIAIERGRRQGTLTEY
jgi:ABC-type polysaccharide/polyol phosphate export permease